MGYMRSQTMGNPLCEPFHLISLLRFVFTFSLLLIIVAICASAISIVMMVEICMATITVSKVYLERLNTSFTILEI